MQKNKMKKIILLSFCFIFALNIKAQSINFLVKRDLSDERALYKLNYNSGIIKSIYQSTKDHISKLLISPDGNYISLIETKKGTFKKQGSGYIYDIPPKNRLIILNSDGNIVRVINDDVRKYTWCPDENKIAYITGTYKEGGFGFTPSGIYILNISTGKKFKIQNIAYPHRLHWLKTNKENSIYVKTMNVDPKKRILRYNLNKKRVEITYVKSIHFSPDGKYYAVFSGETNDICDKNSTLPLCVNIYQTKTNQLISKFFNNEELGTPTGWVYDHGHFFMFTKQEYDRYEKSIIRGGKTYTGTFIKGVKKSENFIYNVETKKLVQKFDGKVTNPKKWGEWIGSIDFIVVEKLDQSNQKIGKENEIIIKKLPAEYRMK